MILPYVLILILGNNSIAAIPFQSLSLCDSAGKEFVLSSPGTTYREYHCVIRK